jgi:type II secretory pathway component GspD/PulD (secretin)
MGLGGPGFKPGGGGFGGPPGAFPQGLETRLSLDRRTGSIIARGPAIDLDVAADLMKVLDTPPDEVPPEVKSLRAFQLKHATASALAEHATRLDLQIAAVGLDEAKLLLVTGFPDAVQELAQLVKALDVPTPKGIEKQRKLFAPEKQ